MQRFFTVVEQGISIHSLRMEGDPILEQSVAIDEFISIHSLRMEGDTRHEMRAVLNPDISIHSLRMEGDETSVLPRRLLESFQSTPSAWRETEWLCKIHGEVAISIHSLRMEGDGTAYPRFSSSQFQSTPSAWRETLSICNKLSSSEYFNPLPPHGGRPGNRWASRTP